MEEASKHKKNAANALMTANGALHIPIQRKGVITVRAEGGAGVVLFFLLCKSKEAKISSLEVRYLWHEGVHKVFLPFSP